LRRRAGESRRPTPLPPAPPDPPACGTQRVQVLRTYPAKRPRFPFATDGERSIARAYRKAFARARHSIYIEDQYLWSADVADALAEALRRESRLRIIAIVPRYPDRDGRFTGPPYRIGQLHALERVRAVGGDRVAVYDIENDAGAPIYVHAKACVVDDTWVIVGSDNLNRRSWTNDSELSCAIVDDETTFARDLRLRLWREHLGAVDDTELVDFEQGFHAFERVALRLEVFHAEGCRGPRPAGRVRRHVVAPVARWQQAWAMPMYRFLVDPDGRPRAMRRRDEM
jgi:phosphatidylserine/phosphatidylglycerophosphate/cardiolipin synthase-like enzyme